MDNKIFHSLKRPVAYYSSWYFLSTLNKKSEPSYRMEFDSWFTCAIYIAVLEKKACVKHTKQHNNHQQWTKNLRTKYWCTAHVIRLKKLEIPKILGAHNARQNSNCYTAHQSALNVNLAHYGWVCVYYDDINWEEKSNLLDKQLFT